VERHWKPVNYPVLDDHKRVSYLLHHVENVTDAVLTFKKQQQVCRTDYLEKARHCGQQAAGAAFGWKCKNNISSLHQVISRWEQGLQTAEDGSFSSSPSYSSHPPTRLT